MIHRMLIIASVFMVLNACKKNDDEPEDTDPTQPSITITSPDSSSVFHIGDTVIIKSDITDNSLHEVQLHIIDANTSAELYNKTLDAHDLTILHVNEKWAVTPFTGIKMVKLTISAEDHAAHKVLKSVPFTLN